MYNKFIEEIISLMFNNTDFSYDRVVFSKRGRQIGEEVYKIGGYRGLFNVINNLPDILQERGYSHDNLSDLRELECSWAGICEEFQA